MKEDVVVARNIGEAERASGIGRNRETGTDEAGHLRNEVGSAALVEEATRHAEAGDEVARRGPDRLGRDVVRVLATTLTAGQLTTGQTADIATKIDRGNCTTDLVVTSRNRSLDDDRVPGVGRAESQAVDR